MLLLHWLCAFPQDPKFLPELAHVLPSLGAVAVKMQVQQFTALMQKAAAAQVITFASRASAHFAFEVQVCAAQTPGGVL